MDALNLQGLWPNFPEAAVVPPAPAPARRRGAANADWKAVLEAWRKRREEEEEAERKRLEREVAKYRRAASEREALVLAGRAEAERVDAEDRFTVAFIGEVDE